MTALPPPVFAEIAARFESQRRAFAADRNPDWKTRIERLNRLLALVEQSEDAIVAAVDDDFGHRAAQETRLAELFVVRAGVRHARRRLKRWMRNRAVATDLHFLPGRNRLAAQPLGVVGVVSPWNYPIQLSLGPALAALAAGNRVMIKPSELTPRTSALLEKLAAAHFDPDELSVVNGDAETGKAFVSLSFDHLIFTGSTAVGRQVALAAAANLTPVTLELGGKSPAIFDASCEMAIACRRLAYGKLLNAGQTCIAPDYLLVPKGQARAAADLLAHAMARMYPTLASNRDYTAIVSERHRQRLIALVQEARAAGAEIIEVNPAGETFDAASRKLEPTLVIGAPETTRLMREEIFGPVLPILEYERLEDADRDRQPRRAAARALLVRPRRGALRSRAARNGLRRRDRERLHVAPRPGRAAVRRRRGERHGRLPRRMGLSHLQQIEAGLPSGALERGGTAPAALRQDLRLAAARAQAHNLNATGGRRRGGAASKVSRLPQRRPDPG